MKMRRGAALGALALSVVGMVAAYRLGRARADGVPMVNPLYYGGMLDDGGRPVEGTRNVTVRLWDAASAGATVCTTNAGATAFSGGRFRVALDGACVGAVRANPELWAELQVEGTVFPRSKLGAVPYALEAGRATGAAGALEARLAAVEGRMGGRQVVIGSWRPTTPGESEMVAVPCPVPAAHRSLHGSQAPVLHLRSRPWRLLFIILVHLVFSLLTEPKLSTRGFRALHRAPSIYSISRRI
nr:hypothetical protein [Deltaproteobacteria bacterium]